MDEKLLEILACPRCDERPPVELRGERLVCTKCGYGYPIIDGIPHMLPEDGISPEELNEKNA